MLTPYFNKQATRAEIGFERFPCGPCATKADRSLRALDGVIHVLLDPSVCRATVVFDPKRVNIPRILTALEPSILKPKVISVMTPLKGVLDAENHDL